MKTTNFLTMRGFTLVELIVTILVASLVLMAAVSSFIVQNKVSAIQTATSDVQISGQVALDLLERDIRMAGYGVGTVRGISTQDNASSGDALRSVGTDAVQIQYSTATPAAGTRGTRNFNYYIAKTGEGGLVRQDSLPGGTTDTIASNVEDMQISVVDDATTGAKQVTVSLLVKSAAMDPNYTTAPPVIGNGIVRAADNYRRRVYTTTISPRNYGL